MNTGSADFDGLENPDAETEMVVSGELKDSTRTCAVRSAGKTSVRQPLTNLKGR